MEKNLKILKDNIKKKKNELDIAISNNCSPDEIYKKSQDVDSAIALYLKANEYYNDENIRLLNKYKKLLDKDFKIDLINKMKDDVKDKFENMQESELEHFCNNLYVLCILKANNIEEQEIIKQLMYRNSIFLSEMQQSGRILDTCDSEIELNYYTKLKNKYLKIIKNYFF